MAITAFTSTAIIDATTIGTTVLTASSEGIAADAIGLGATDDVTFNSVSLVDGDFSGVLTTPNVTGTTNLYMQSSTNSASMTLATSGAVTINAYNAIYQQFTTLGVGYRKACYPIFNGSLDLGLNTNRWGATYLVDGSISGTLDVESGGSTRLFNLGSDGDTDTEYLETSFDTNVATIASKATGTGVQRNISIDAPSVDFSGNVIMSGLPTSDPLVAGQLYTTTGGTLKVSAG